VAPPPVNRLDWAGLNGVRVEQVLLIDGLPGVFLQAGSLLTSVGWVDAGAGTDPAWWPQASGLEQFSTYTKPWMRVADLEIGFRARPVDGTVECTPVQRVLYDSGTPGTTATPSSIGGQNSPSPSAFFTSRALLTSAPLIASVEPTDTTIHVLSNARLAALFGGTGPSFPFFVYLGQECIQVYCDASDPTALDVVGGTAGRGLFGSLAAIHLGSTATGQLTANVWAGIPSLLNRRATVWLVQVSADGTTGTNPTCVFMGPIAAGSGAKGATWVLKINSILNAPPAQPVIPQLTVQGYSHADGGGIFAQGTILPDASTFLAAFWLAPSEYGLLTILTSAATAQAHPLPGSGIPTPAPSPAPWNQGGYHLDLGSFVRDWNAAAVYACVTQGWSPSATMVLSGPRPGIGDLYLQGLNTAESSTATIYAGWLPSPYSVRVGNGIGENADDGPQFAYSLGTPPTAWQVLGLGRNVFFTLPDLSQIPLTTGSHLNPFLSAGPPASPPTSSNTVVWYCLFVPIGNTSAPCQIVYYDDTTYAAQQFGYVVLNVWGVSSTPITNVTVQQPTAATLGYFVASATWYDAIWGLLYTMASGSAVNVTPDYFDWSQIALIATGVVTPFSPTRYYPVDLSQTTYMDLFKNEVRFNGLVLAPYFGRVACCRITDTAPNAATSFTVTSAMLRVGPKDEPLLPTDSENSDGLLSSFNVNLLGGGSVQFNDLVDIAESGKGGSIDTTFYGAYPGVVVTTTTRTDTGTTSTSTVVGNQNTFDPTADALAFANLGQHAIGPWCSTYRVVTLPLTLAAAGVQIGDVIQISEWLLPNDEGGRGLNGAIGTVIGYRTKLFASGTGGTVDLDVRLSNPGFAGYAPELLVASIGGAGGAVLTVDTSTWGANGFTDPTAGPAGTGFNDGGTSQFNVGDVCQLLQINSASPMTPFDCTITAVGANTITVSPAPSSPWVTLAATPLSVMLSFVNDYDSATNAGQQAWCWIGDSLTNTLGAAQTVTADLWAP
jgi:hypothetical protein